LDGSCNLLMENSADYALGGCRDVSRAVCD
jgi:hypothetical protein